jgi:hypothetical protein
MVVSGLLPFYAPQSHEVLGFPFPQHSADCKWNCHYILMQQVNLCRQI